MTPRAGRILCPRCGANNFDTVSACWKCQAPLSAAAAPLMQPPMMQSPNPPPGAVERMMPARPLYTTPGEPGDPRVARRAAILLAITMPWIGLPVGWAFMMIEDQRRQAIGRFCAIWSTVALVFQLLLMYVAVQSLAPTIQAVVGIMAKSAQNQSSGFNGLGGGGAAP